MAHDVARKNSTNPAADAIGFVTVVNHPQHGLFGGLLVLNLAGRPLAFHCTTPLKPNRAQEILFGFTLESYLYGEQIGRALLSQTQETLAAAFTDLAPVLSAREQVDVPLLWVHSPEPPRDDRPLLRVDAAHSPGLASPPFQSGRNRLSTAPNYAADQQALTGQLTSCLDRLDLLEPFGRIREAIEEAQRSGR